MKKTKVHHYSVMYIFIFLNKIIENWVAFMLYAMLWYTMVCYDEWKSIDILCASNDMVWDFKSMLCHDVCCKRYEWTDCSNPL